MVTSDGWVKGELKKVIAELDWAKARTDLEPFVHEDERKTLDSFSVEFFMSLVDRLMIK